MMLHLINHENTDRECTECNIQKINEHLCYAKNKCSLIIWILHSVHSLSVFS